MRKLFAGLLVAIALVGQTARDLKFERTAPPLPDKRSRWAVVVGVSSYKYAPPTAQLRYAHRDAEEFARFLRSSEGGAIAADHVRLLTDQSATLAGVRAALHTWLPRSAGPNDIVYMFFAGHAVVAERNEGYFVAHDSDPQNLHATGLSFREVNDMLSSKLRAGTVVLLADACHAGGIGWTSDPAAPSQAQGALEALGAKDRAFLKLLASRPSERSFEDERWGGGHGVFTFSVLTALRGAAERERDGFVRVSELIDYVSRVVPEQTGAKQNPRIAGNFEGSLPVAALPADQRKDVARGRDAHPSRHAFDRSIYRQRVSRQPSDRTENSLSRVRLVRIVSQSTCRVRKRSTSRSRCVPGLNALDLQKSPEFALFRLRSAIRTGAIVGQSGAWEFYKSQSFPAQQSAAAEALITSALEETGQDCVSDYVQSTTNALKGPMFLRAAEAFTLVAYPPPKRSVTRSKAAILPGTGANRWGRVRGSSR